MRGAELLNRSRRGGEARGLRSALILLPLGLLLAGCAGAGTGGGSGNEGPMGTGNAGDQGLFGSQIQTTTVAPETQANNGTPGGDTSNFSCPPVEVRGGAAAWQVTDPADGGVRYQATLGQFSRECRYTAPDMTMRVGIQGRVLLGAKGGPGRINVPIRVAVVQEGPAPKSIWTKFYSVPVEIGQSVLQVDFGLVADDISFPRPSYDVLDKYVVYIGFDPQGANEKPVRPRPAQQTRPRPAPATSAAPATPRPAASTTPPRTAPAAQTTPVQSAPATTAPAAAAPVQTAPAPAATAPAASTPAATAPAASAPAASAPASSGDAQWIGAPAPSAGTFSQ
ncbi:hypothetical protein [Ancylobacter radicis]|uniref:Uncharacterized protein n=1 Tax=Ancylobacter radicis TaxID=2836179 RepID=A0ABS5R6R4_9HYPH|nr:hypothetical protein [Ancylobacter radicis]MBS9477356.1 hypothetical protein [Ancylobacter radicis]